MSIMGRYIPRRVLAVAVLLVVAGGGVLLPADTLDRLKADTLGRLTAARTAGPVREIRLVVRNMAFFLEADPSTPNPVIDVRAGERVRIVLANRERGMIHDFAVPSFAVALEPVKWSETVESVIEIPTRPGTYQYICRPHEAMMRGSLRVFATTP